MFTKTQLCSKAAVLVGCNPIDNLDAADTEAVVARELVDDTIAWLLGTYRWRFAAHMAPIDRLVSAPASRFAAAYALPGDVVLVNTVLVRDVPIEFDRYDAMILCDASEGDEVTLDYTRQVDVAMWPPYFFEVAKLRLASMMAVPLAEDVQKQQLLDSQFLRAFAQGRSLDSQGRTAPRLRLGSYAGFSVRTGGTLRGDVQ